MFTETNAADVVDILQEEKQAMAMLSGKMNSVCHIYFAHLRDLEELRVVDEEDLVESVDLLKCNSAYKVMRQSELENKGQDVFGINGTSNFRDMAKKMILNDRQSPVLRSAICTSTRCQR